MDSHANKPRIVNIDDPEWSGMDEDGGRWKRLAQQAGGARLGCTLEEIQPDGQPAAYHYHLANEEALYVLDGRGTVRTPSGEHSVEAGDYIAFPADESGAHAVVNTSDAVLRCLIFSTMREPDIVVYPDDGTFHLTGEGVPLRRGDGGSHESVFPYHGTVAADD